MRLAYGSDLGVFDSLTLMPRSSATIRALTRFTSSVWYCRSPFSTEIVTGGVESFPTSPR